jgi:hypothetical protein
MGKIISGLKGIALPNGVAERREQERLDKIAPLADAEQKKEMEDFQGFLDEHNVTFEVHFDTRETIRGKKTIGQGLTFISKLWIEEEAQIQ